MPKSKKTFNKGIIILNKGERIAVFNLLGLIVIFLGYSVFRPMINFSNKDQMAFHNLDSLLALQEAAKVKPINDSPNHTENEKTGRPSSNDPGKRNTTSKESTKITPMPSTKNKTTASTTLLTTPKAISPMELNSSDSTELTALPQIGNVMASRIHRYRNRLGGFVSMEQLFEIKGMDSARFETIKPYLLLDKNAITKIDVNRDEFKTLLRHPYLEYEQVKAIVNHRERKGIIKDWQQLHAIVGEANPLLKEYVSF